jgi:hypothetical protein
MTPTPVPPAALAGLHDVVVPQPVSFLPATPAWLVVLVLLLAALSWTAVSVLRRYGSNRYRREAAAALREIEKRLHSPATRQVALAELPVLVKRVALVLAPRAEVAGLNGDPWLELLDRTWRGAAFSKGPGRLLPEIAYDSQDRLAAILPTDVEALVGLLQMWIPGHHKPSVTPPARTFSERAA